MGLVQGEVGDLAEEGAFGIGVHIIVVTDGLRQGSDLVKASQLRLDHLALGADVHILDQRCSLNLRLLRLDLADIGDLMRRLDVARRGFSLSDL